MFFERLYFLNHRAVSPFHIPGFWSPQ